MKRRTLKVAALALACMIPSVGFCGLVNADGQIPEAAYHAENEYMEIAIAEAREGIYNGDGGPFGSVIVKDGEIIGQGHNMVLANNDSTCHGEISAIRNAEAAIGSYDAAVALNGLAEKEGIVLDVHLEIDTGARCAWRRACGPTSMWFTMAVQSRTMR